VSPRLTEAEIARRDVPRWISRRTALKTLGALALTGVPGASYAVGIEPMRLAVTRRAITPTAPWPAGLSLRIAALADFHACEPWMGVERIRAIVERTNALEPDIVLLLGDYVAGRNHLGRIVGRMPHDSWAEPLAGLRAPLGSHAVLGNHDWWDDPAALRRDTGRPEAGLALERHGIRVYENNATRLEKDGHPFWLAGLGDQLAFLPARRRDRARRVGLDDLPGTMAQIPEGAPAILMAHEPDIFPSVPARVALTLSGHTHGGQVRLFGYSPVVPSRFRNRYAYGHVESIRTSSCRVDSGSASRLSGSGCPPRSRWSSSAGPHERGRGSAARRRHRRLPPASAALARAAEGRARRARAPSWMGAAAPRPRTRDRDEAARPVGAGAPAHAGHGRRDEPPRRGLPRIRLRPSPHGAAAATSARG
jgi:predicted MPP superfamily phosphohydrolase